jgi:hypothetical protein
MLSIASATAATYTVGIGSGCTHSTFRDALDAATADATTGPHVIRLALPTITLADVDYVIADPQRDIEIIGGYTSCATAVPTGRTVLNRTQPNRSVLEVRNGIANSRRTITLERLTLQGGNLSTGFGGGIAVTNKATVILADATRVESNQAPNGGGVSLLTLTTELTDGPRLVVAEDSRVCANTASGAGANGNGGGVYMVGGAELTLLDGEICDNQASRHGGGVYMAGGNRISLGPLAGDLVSIDGNLAGIAGFNTTTGFGGGVYAGPQSGIVYVNAPTPQAAISLSISNNQANFGGALFAEGTATAGGAFSFHELRNTLLSTNLARGSGGAVELRNAVDLRLSKFGAGRCQLFGTAPCVIGIGNRALNTGESTSFGAGGFARLSHATGAPRPALRVGGALFIDNEDPNGTAAVIDARGDSAVRILRSVFTSNSAGGLAGARAVVESRSDVLFGYNTVLDNEVDRLLWVSVGTINATGSILHAPGVTPFFGSAGGLLVHGGCLLSHTTAGLPTGVVVAAPQLGAGFEPLLGSAAVDRCGAGVGDTVWPANIDGYGFTTPIDIATVPNTGGAWDLGAIEARVDLFANGFE